MANDYGYKINALRANIKTIQYLYWDEKWTHEQIAKKYGCSRQLISKYGHFLGIKGVVTSSRCIKEKNANWKGGICFSKDGKLINISKTQRLEHVVIVENILGRKLRGNPDREVVHHINGNKKDNRTNNLLICTNSYHQWLHGRMCRKYMQEKFGGNSYE